MSKPFPAWFVGRRETDPFEWGYDGHVWEAPPDEDPEPFPDEVARVPSEANAHLISAVPEMYYCLRARLDGVAETGRPDSFADDLRMVADIVEGAGQGTVACLLRIRAGEIRDALLKAAGVANP